MGSEYWVVLKPSQVRMWGKQEVATFTLIMQKNLGQNNSDIKKIFFLFLFPLSQADSTMCIFFIITVFSTLICIIKVMKILQKGYILAKYFKISPNFNITMYRIAIMLYKHIESSPSIICRAKVWCEFKNNLIFRCSLWWPQWASLVVTLSGRQGREKSQHKFQCILSPHIHHNRTFRYFQVLSGTFRYFQVL